MGRPADWWVLDLDGDPTPGDPFRVRELARKFSELSADAFDAAAEVRRLAGEGGVAGWVGEAGTVFAGAIGELPGQLDKLETSYGMVGPALTTYAGELESAQSQADGALVRGRSARDRLEAAQGQVATAQSDVASARTALDVATGVAPLTTVPASWSAQPALPPDPAAVATATNSHTAAVNHLAAVNGQVSAAQADIDAERRLALAAKSLREGAARTCKGTIDRASDAGIHNRSFWEKAGDFLGKAWDVAVKIANVVLVVAAVVALIAGGPVLWALVAAASLIVLADTLAKYSRGEASLWDVGFSLLNFVPGGRALSTGAALARGAGRLRALGSAVRGGWGTVRNMAGGLRANARTMLTRVFGRDPVDVVSGEMVLTQTDVELPGLLPLVLERSHLSTYRAGRLFGPTWASTLDQRLEVDHEGVCFTVADGTILVYPPPPADGTPVLPAEGARWPLAAEPQGDGYHGGGYTVHDPRTGRTLCFPAPDPAVDTAAGQVAVLPLAAVADRNGHRMTLHYGDDATLMAVSYSGGYHVAVSTTDGLVTALRLVGTDNTNGTHNTNGTDNTAGSTAGSTNGSASSAVEVGPDLPPYLPGERLNRADRLNGAGPLTLVRFGYDADRRLTEIVNSSGLPLRFGYDRDGRITGWEDRNGCWYSYVYDDAGRCVRTAGSGGFLNGTFTYDQVARTTVATDSFGHASTFAYNALGQVVTETDRLGHVTTSEWGRYDWLLSRTDPLGRTTSYAYDEVGNLTRMVRPDGAVASAAYDGRSRPTTVIEADGARWEHAYDERGNLTSVVDPAGATTTLAYDPDRPGHRVAVTDALGHSTRVDTNAAGLPTRVVSPGGAVTGCSFDRSGRVETVIDPVGGVVQLAWTVEGKLASRTLPDGTTEHWAYDGEGNLVEHVDAAGLSTRFEYTHFDLPSARTDPDGARLEFGYDTELRLTSVTNPQGLVWTYDYDLLGRLVAETDFNGRTLTYTYDAAGQLVARTNHAGQTVEFVRTVLGEIAEKHTPTGVTTFAFDLAGRLVRAANADADCRFAFDPLGRAVAETVNGRTVTSTYDVVGQRTRRSTPSGADSRWEWTSDGLPAALRTAGHALTFDYDPAGRETKRTLDSVVALTQTWEAGHRLTAQAVTTQTGTADTLAPFAEPRPRQQAKLVNRRAYTYSPDGYLTGIDDLLSGARSYQLDPARRVTAVTGTDWREKYVYDPAGNLKHATWSSPVRPSGLDDLGSEAQGEREYSGTLVRRAGKVRYEYDALGRVTLRRHKRLSGQPRTWRYAWDVDDRLTRVVTPDGQHWRYLYDPFGRRIAKQREEFDGAFVERIDFTWDGLVLAEQTHATGHGVVKVTTWDWEPDSFRPLAQTERRPTHPHPANDSDADARIGADYRDQTWFDARFHAIVTDLVGTATELLDADGDVAWRHSTTLWGVPTRVGVSDAVDCPLRFPGQYHDPETSTNYNYYRYYETLTGGFTSSDPVGLDGGPNPYSYVINPTGWLDPLGLTPCEMTVFHYTDKDGFNAIRAGNPYHIRPGSSKNGPGPFFTDLSPGQLLTPNAFKKLGLTRDKSQYVIEALIPKAQLVPLRGGRGAHIFSVPGGITIPRPKVNYIGPTSGWGIP